MNVPTPMTSPAGAALATGAAGACAPAAGAPAGAWARTRLAAPATIAAAATAAAAPVVNAECSIERLERPGVHIGCGVAQVPQGRRPERVGPLGPGVEEGSSYGLRYRQHVELEIRKQRAAVAA